MSATASIQGLAVSGGLAGTTSSPVSLSLSSPLLQSQLSSHMDPFQEQLLIKIPALRRDVGAGDLLHIPLPAPFSNIILTRSLLSDAAGIVASFNDPRVYRYTVGPPLPYLTSHAEIWIRERQFEHYETLALLRSLIDHNKEIAVAQTPFRTIREVQPDGRRPFIGDVGLLRCTFLEVDDEDERKRLTEENARKAVGDPTIVWMFTDYLSPAYHGRGIMTCALRTLLKEWAIPYMKAHHFMAYLLTGNDASKRVFEKLGFKLIATREGGIPLQGKREKEVGTWTMELVIADSGALPPV